MTPLKIAIYSGVIPSTTFIERLIEGIAVQNNEVYLFGWQEKKVAYSKNIKQYTFGPKWNKLYVLLRYTFLLTVFQTSNKKKLDAIIKQQKGNSNNLKVKYYPVLYHRPDIFHLQWAKSIEDWIWVQEFGIKLILSLRGTHVTISPKDDVLLEQTFKKNFPRINGFHSVANSIAKEAEKYGANLNKTRVVYSGLNCDDFHFITKHKNNSPLKIISIGRAHWVKGYSYALDAFSILKQNNFPFEYTIVGVGDSEELLFQRHQLNLEEEVNFLKNMAFQEVKRQIQTADILLLSSIEEGIANVVLEAMALGTLVISTNCGGMQEVLQDGINGFVVPTRNCEAIATAIQKVANLPHEEYQSICLNARKTIETQHTEAIMISEMNILYNTVSNAKN